MKYNINFLKYFKIFNIISLSFFLMSVLLIFFKGLNYGIDFKGGTLLEIKTDNTNINTSTLRDALNTLNLGDVNVKDFGESGNYIVKIEKKIK